ncbi:hypothetical protein ACHAXA_006238 [Cyclostephanos tholiformis]|uniref:MRG domain-containing protein n=1 Tax=Cyclostephanos tholiformis TaxID=382380 RepID=A0ABD3SEA4_9STRA
MTGCEYASPSKSLLDDIVTTPDPLLDHAVDIVDESPPSHQKAVIYSEETIPQSRYKVAQRVYAKDDSTGLLYPAFVRKVMWGPKVDRVNVGSSLVFGSARGGDDDDDGESYEKQSAGENGEDNDEEDDEDARRWDPRRNCWHYYIHYMGWAVKWDRWVQEEYLYEDSAFTVSLSKLLSGEYNKVKPKRRGQKMSLLQLATWMKNSNELEAKHRMGEKELKSGGCEEEKCDDSKVTASEISDTVEADDKSGKNDEPMYCKTCANTGKLIEDEKRRIKKQTIDTDTVIEDARNEQARQVTTAMLRKQAQLHGSGLQMKQKKILSDQLTLPFHLKKILVEEWEVITQCNMVHTLPSKISVRVALDRYLESKLEPLRMEREKEIAGRRVDAGDETPIQVDKPVGSYGKDAIKDGEQSPGKEWIDMVEGIALFFDQALPVNLLFAEERCQYALLRTQILAQRRSSVASTGCGDAIKTMKKENEDAEHSSAPSSEPTAAVPSSGDGKSPPNNILPERMSEIYGCEHLLRLLVRLPGVVAMSPTMTAMETRRIFSHVGDLVRYLQKNQSLFQSSFRKPVAGELRRGGGVSRKRARDK